MNETWWSTFFGKDPNLFKRFTIKTKTKIQHMIIFLDEDHAPPDDHYRRQMEPPMRCSFIEVGLTLSMNQPGSLHALVNEPQSSLLNPWIDLKGLNVMSTWILFDFGLLDCIKEKPKKFYETYKIFPRIQIPRSSYQNIWIKEALKIFSYKMKDKTAWCPNGNTTILLMITTCMVPLVELLLLQYIDQSPSKLSISIYRIITVPH